MKRFYPQHPLAAQNVLGEGITLSTTERLVYVAMCSMARRPERWFDKSMNVLAKATGLSRGTVIRAVTGLEKAKAIRLIFSNRRNDDGGRAPNIYEITGEHTEYDHNRRGQLGEELLDALEDLGLDPRILLAQLSNKQAETFGVYGKAGWLVSAELGGAR
jgi:DNA-binding Lrp family transcriptional regulator